MRHKSNAFTDITANYLLFFRAIPSKIIKNLLKKQKITDPTHPIPCQKQPERAIFS
jgi:hypothetical protein